MDAIVESQFVPVPIKSRKQDIAWQHCHMCKEGEKVQLKCVYCMKIFKGGGIHRIKEHLATIKTGNASPCLRVPGAVRDLMKESLDSITPKRRKTQKDALGDDVMRIANEAETFSHEADANSGLHLIGSHDTLEPGSTPGLFATPEGNSSATGEPKRRGRKRASIRNTGSVANPVPISSAGLGADAVPLNASGVGAKQVNSYVHMAIGRFLFDIGAPLDAVNSVYFKPMVDALVAGGAESLMPSQSDLRSWVLRNSVEETKADVDKISSGWAKSGCTILVDQQKTETKILLNFLADSPVGTVFLRSVDASGFLNNSDAMFDLFKQVVEEAGASNVMQVITSNEEVCVAAAKRLTETYPTLYWTPCAISSLDMILRDFSKLDWINAVIEQARSITRFVYNHSVVLNMVRRYTFGNDIIEPATTRSATNFTTLKRIMDLKHNLQSMMHSQEWVDDPFSKKPGGQEMIEIICNESFWSSGALITRLTYPLLRVLRILSSKKRPAMGFVYAGMYRAKEAIKKELMKREEYAVYWDIIDQWWQQQWQHPLHVAGFHLNPKFFYSFVEVPKDVHSGMLDCIERLVPDIRVQDKIVQELIPYKDAIGDFSRKMAIRARETMLPAEWWSTYGGSCPNLARLAVRILSQTCSLQKHNQNRIPFEQFHNVRNGLEHQRLRDLIFVQSNLRLKQTGFQDKHYVDPVSFEAFSVVEDWVREDICFEDYSKSDWMALEQLTVNTMTLGIPVDEVDELGSGFDDDEIFNRLENGENKESRES